MNVNGSIINIERLVKREKQLIGIEADVTYKEVYWPVRVISAATTKPLDPELQKVFKFITAGYCTRELLEKRLDTAGIDKRLNELMQANMIRIMADNSYEAIALSMVETPHDGSTITYYDAVSGCAINLPHGLEMDAHSKMDTDIPVLAFPPINSDTEQIRYLACLVILLNPKAGRGFEVRAICGYDRISALEEIFYDLLIDNSPRLSGTGLSRPINPLIKEVIDLHLAPVNTVSSIHEEATLPVKHTPILRTKSSVASTVENKNTGVLNVHPVPEITLSSINEKTMLPAKRTPVLRPKSSIISTVKNQVVTNINPEPISKQIPQKQAYDLALEITRGKEMHQEMLFRCLSEAISTIIIVTPFIRSMLDNIRFIDSIKQAVNRGVKITVIHGMPESRFPNEGIDEKEKENDRIQRALFKVNGYGKIKQLHFCRVPDMNIAGKGDHSKILICDTKWAVITSYNWLSIPENRDETGILIHDERVINELAALYERYLDVKRL